MSKIYRLLILVMMVCVISGCSNQKNHEQMQSEERLKGTWNGAIQVPDQPLNILVKFDEKEELTGTISIPVQNVEDFGLLEIKLNGDKVNFKMPLQGQKIKIGKR
ncbi:hypothetical protein ACJROX_05795 [Pseudalkalibacillus sp. A8]|uniref:hypothetical protein n=1 Tax=Pseudalkalibacillus sp. A8 TaxID=3382641 RepID=UPI0038B563E6